MAGHYSPFNLVDIYRWIMGTKLTPINSSPDSSKKEKKIIFHPFSSNTKKSWGHSKWSELLYNFLKTFSDYDVILVGSPSEQSMAKKILEHQILNNYSSKILNLVGKSTIKQLFQEIKNAQLFVGHDSMCGHIASYVGTRSITISLGTVRPQETTPYGSGNINIVPKTACFPCFPTDKCDNYLCHKDISINKTIKVIADCLQGHEIIDDSDPIINTSRIFTTKIKEDFGQLCLPMTEVNTVNDLFKSYYMILWSYLLNEKEVNLKIPNLLKIDLDAVSFYQEGIEHLFELVSFAVTFSGQILKEAENKMPNVEKIQSYANKLVEVDQLANLLKGPYPELTPLINYFEVAKANVEGESILEVAQNTFVTNHSYKNSIQILFELMEKTMSSYNISKAESAASHS